MKRFYLYAVVSEISLDQYLWFIYLGSVGFSLYEIGIGYAVFQITNMVTDIPFSLLSDKFGRKAFLVIGAALEILSVFFLLILDGNHFILLILATVLMAISSTVVVSVDRSYLNEFTEKEKLDFDKTLSKYMMFVNTSVIIGGIGGGFVSTILSFKWMYGIQIIISSLTLILAFMLPNLDIRQVKEIENKIRLKTRVKKEIREFVANWKGLPTVFLIFLIGAAVYWTLSSLVLQLSEPYLSHMGLNNLIITLVFTVANVFAMFGNKLVGEAKHLFRLNQWVYVAPFLYAGVLILFVGSTGGASLIWLLPMVGLFLGKILSGINEIAFDGKIISLAPKAYKSTTLSILETGIALFLAISFPILGMVQNHGGYFAMYLVLAGLFILLGIGAFVWSRKMNVEGELGKVNVETKLDDIS